MKIQCNVCEAAEANVLCCADEAALCWSCDQKVHAANKLASKHQRVKLCCSSSKMPKCDICQETIGYFFCLEDRALLCRKCDVAIHTANSLVSVHQRFLLTGVKVGHETVEPTPPSTSLEKLQSQSKEKISGLEPHYLPKKTSSVPLSAQSSKNLPVQDSLDANFSPAKVPLDGGSITGSISQWQLDDFLLLNDYNQNCNFMAGGSSKVDTAKLGEDTDWSPIIRAADAELEGDECMGLVPDSFWAVPQMVSPPTASGLQDWSNTGVFVPDICLSPSLPFEHHRSSVKRRR